MGSVKETVRNGKVQNPNGDINATYIFLGFLSASAESLPLQVMRAMIRQAKDLTKFKAQEPELKG